MHRTAGSLLIVTAVIVVAGPSIARGVDLTATALLEAAGTRQGLVVTVGASSGQLESDLAAAASGTMLVQNVATDRAAVDAARGVIAKANNYGYATAIYIPTLKRLPYNDHVANLVVVDLDAAGAPGMDEVVRVTSPFGVSYVKQSGTWKALRKPLPKSMGEWSHFNHGADGNPQSSDALVGAPRGIQWFTSTFANDPSQTYRFAGGRMYVGTWMSNRYSGARTRMFLARDAFNGLPLWEQPETIATLDIRPKMERVTVADEKRVITVMSDAGFARAADAHTGRELVVYDKGLRTYRPKEKNARRAATSPTSGAVDGVGGAAGAGTGDEGSMSQLLQVLAEGRLLQARDDDAVALDPDTGNRLWAWTGPKGNYAAWIAAGDGKLFIALSDQPEWTKYSYNNNFWFICSVTALDAVTGRHLWTSEAVKDFATFGIVYADGGVFVQHAGIDRKANREPSTARRSLSGPFGDLIRLDAATGKEVFRVNVGQVEPADTFWHNQLRVQDGMVYPGFGTVVRGFDIKTGQPGPRLYSRNKDTLTHVLGFCSQVRGTANGQVGGKFASFIDMRTGSIQFTAIARNNCDVAHFPAYGNIYTGADGCGCAQFLRGTVALQSVQATATPADIVADSERLETGVRVSPTALAAGAWPTLKGDNTLSSRSATTVQVQDKAKPTATFTLPVPTLRGPIGTEWKRSNSRLGPITPPVIAGDLLVAAVTDTHEVLGLDAGSGEIRWSHRAGGRISSPPTLWNGLVLFGASDGTVTALRATDGALAWRFFAAPTRRQIIVDGQLESLWPVHGSVLVHEGKAYAMAGRHVLADGGCPLYCLDAATGALIEKQMVDNRPTSDSPPTATLYEMQGVLADVLTMNAQGNLIGMGPIVIDPATLKWVNLRLVNMSDKPTIDGKPNPFKRPADNYVSAGSFTIGKNTPGLMTHMVSPSVGIIDRRCSFGGTKEMNGFRFGAVYGYETKYKGQHIVRDGHTLYLFPGGRVTRIDLKPDWSASGEMGKDRRAIGTDIGVTPPDIFEGAILAGDRFYAAGGSTVTMLAVDGKPAGSLTMAAPVVTHGIAAANNTLYVSLDNGTIATYAASDR